MKKRLLIASDSFLPRWDGISRFLIEIIPKLNKFDISVAAPKFEGSPSGLDNVNIKLFRTSKIRIADYHLPIPGIKGIESLVANSDIVFVQTIGPIGLAALHYAKKHGKPVAGYVHSVDWHLFSKSIKYGRKSIEFAMKKLIPRIYNKFNLLMVPYPDMINILDKIGVSSKRVPVFLGIDTDKFVPPKSIAIAKQKLGIDPNKITIGYLGRFGREKNLVTLYNVFRSINDKFSNVQLLLVGGEVSFPDMRNIIVLPSVKNPVPYYNAMDIYVLPSLTETTSLTTLEAMSCQLPVCASNVGLIPKYIDHKENGFLFSPLAEEKLKLILSILVEDSKLRSSIGVNARRTTMKYYSWFDTANDISDYLDSLCLDK